jgi:hypothetical protein
VWILQLSAWDWEELRRPAPHSHFPLRFLSQISLYIWFTFEYFSAVIHPSFLLSFFQWHYFSFPPYIFHLLHSFLLWYISTL